MIKSANQHPVFALLSPQGNAVYKVPPYQREYSWQKGQWEALFDDLIEAEGAHFLGTIICLDQSIDALETTILRGHRRAAASDDLSLLLAAVYSVLDGHKDDPGRGRVDGPHQSAPADRRQRRLSSPAQPPEAGSELRRLRVCAQEGGLPVDGQKSAYVSLRKVHRCFQHFRDEIAELAEAEETTVVASAERVLEAVQRAILVKIEVASHADAFVLFESLNNRGMPLSPVDLIKNHLLAQAEKRGHVRRGRLQGLERDAHESR